MASFGTQPRRHRNRRGGGGIPRGGLYGGRAGEALTNQDPISYWRSLIQRGGGLTGTSSPSDTFINEQLMPYMQDDYTSRLAKRQNLSVKDYTRGVWGAGYRGKKGNRADIGHLGVNDLTGNTRLGRMYQNWYSNENPISYSVGELSKLGGYDAGAGNQGFQDWYASSWVPQQQLGLDRARQATAPTLSMRQYLGGEDVLGDARRAYALRPSVARVPAPVAPEGRYSWWN
jgi:hypothetical protein